MQHETFKRYKIYPADVLRPKDSLSKTSLGGLFRLSYQARIKGDISRLRMEPLIRFRHDNVSATRPSKVRISLASKGRLTPSGSPEKFNSQVRRPSSSRARVNYYNERVLLSRAPLISSDSASYFPPLSPLFNGNESHPRDELKNRREQSWVSGAS